MKNIITLDESDIARIVKRVISENQKVLLKESKDVVNKGILAGKYKEYNTLGSAGVFDRIFKKERELGLAPIANFINGCATKVSLALAAAGQKVDAAYIATSGPEKGTPIQTSAIGLKNNLTKLWGEPDVKVKGAITESELQKKVGQGNTGIMICAPCGFGGGASGHATVWSKYFGTDKKGGTLDDTTYHLDNPGAEISIWRVGGNS
jgi:hypothetical protein